MSLCLIDCPRLFTLSQARHLFAQFPRTRPLTDGRIHSCHPPREHIVAIKLHFERSPESAAPSSCLRIGERAQVLANSDLRPPALVRIQRDPETT